MNNAMLTKGDIYRLGAAVTEAGERMAHVSMASPGAPTFGAAAEHLRRCRKLIRLGVMIKGLVIDCPVRELQ